MRLDEGKRKGGLGHRRILRSHHTIACLAHQNDEVQRLCGRVAECGLISHNRLMRCDGGENSTIQARAECAKLRVQEAAGDEHACTNSNNRNLRERSWRLHDDRVEASAAEEVLPQGHSPLAPDNLVSNIGGIDLEIMREVGIANFTPGENIVPDHRCGSR